MSATDRDRTIVALIEPRSPLSAHIATVQFSLWGPLTGHSSAKDYEQFLSRAALSSGLPAVLVATRNGRFVGSVNLLENEMTTRPELSPWMAQLYVIESDRGHGVGRTLIEAAVDHAAKLGYRRLHLFTSGTLPSFYVSLGWKPMEMTEYLGKPRTIMIFETP